MKCLLSRRLQFLALPIWRCANSLCLAQRVRRTFECLIYLPQSTPRPMPGLVWIHGGGYVIGTPEGDDARVKQIVREVGCVVVSVDYRLSPETPFPGGVEDCYAALKWLQGQAGELGVDADRLAIGAPAPVVV